jgi:hypothetical protein
MGVAMQYLGRLGSLVETEQAEIAEFAREQQVPIELTFTNDPLAGDKL